MTREIDIPEPLAAQIEDRIADTEFDTVETYVQFVLREVVADQREAEAERTSEDETVERRLESLGYL